jgi:predicted lipoprotein
MYQQRFSLLLLIVALFAFSACDTNSEGDNDPCAGNFDQTSMFTNIADNLIIPAYSDFAEKATALDNAANNFIANGTEADFDSFRASWEAAYLSYQNIAQYEFGPAEDQLLRSTIGNFPANTEEIENILNNGTFDINAPDAYFKGFAALDYLLYGLSDNKTEIMSSFLDDSSRADHQRALSLAITNQIKEVALAVQNGWTNMGYKAAFIENTGTAAGTSLSLLINSWNENYEITKRDRIGIPSGVLTLGFTNPENVEAFYSGISLELLSESVAASERLYLAGIDDLLIFIDAQKAGESLDVLIKDQFTSAKNAVSQINGTLSSAVDNDPSNVSTAYNELTKQVVQIKTDLPSVICVAITYVDNPSDSD